MASQFSLTDACQKDQGTLKGQSTSSHITVLKTTSSYLIDPYQHSKSSLKCYLRTSKI